MQLEANNLAFGYRKGHPILQQLSLAIQSGERVGIQGTSGCGKTTLARLLAGYLHPWSGQIRLDGKPLPSGGYHPVQMIHQHPERAVNPRWKMGMVLEEAGMPPPSLLDALGIRSQWLNRYPHTLSGGELQRFCIARAMGTNTRFLIADEITAMLDVITQAQLWQILLEQAEEHQWGMLIITHNQALMERVCTRILPFASCMEEQMK